MNCKKMAGAFLAGILLCSAGMQTNLSAEASTSADMSISQNGVDFICSLEGFNAKCYWDYSQSSIGYGTKCTHSSVQPHKTGMHTITKEEAKQAMMSGIEKNYAMKVRKQTVNVEMNQNQFDALTSLAYNCGGGLQRIYKCPLTQYLRGELSDSEARTKYYNYIVYAGGTYCKGLYNRRVKEANLFFTPVSNVPAPSTASISIQGNRTVFDTTETLIFHMSSDTGKTYYLGIDCEGERLLTPKVEDGTIYAHTFEKAGHYTVYISACNESGYIDSQKIEFEIRDTLLKGDINQDGSRDIADLQLLQSYLQHQQTFTKVQSEFADSNQDGKVNIFDLLFLKHLLLS